MSSDSTPKNSATEISSEPDVMDVSFLDDFESGKLDLDEIIEEVNILDLEGFIFAFDPRNKGLRVGEHEFDLGDGKTLTLDFSSKHGQPSWMAYRILQAVFKKITDDGCSDDGYPNTVSFSERGMAKDLGRKSWGGSQSAEFKEAVLQLHRTNVSIKVKNSKGTTSKSRKQWVSADFYLFPRVRSAGVGDRITACAITVDDKIIESLNKKYWVKFDFGDIKTLEPTGMVMYKRLYRYFMSSYSSKLAKLKREGSLSTANISEARKSVTFSKMYADILSGWFGGDLTQKDRPGKIREQFGGHLRGVKATGLIRSWSPEKAADGNYKLVFQPGMGFFRKYEQLWLTHNHQPSLPFEQSKGEIEVAQPLQVIEYFYEKLLGVEGTDNVQYPPKEFKFAQELVSKYGFEDTLKFIDFAISEAPKTGFKMVSFNAIRTYLSAWQSDVSQKVISSKRLESRRAQEKVEALKSEYDDYRRKVVHNYRQSLSEADLEDLELQAQGLCLVESPGVSGVAKKAAMAGAKARLLSERVEVLEYKEWLETRAF